MIRIKKVGPLCSIQDLGRQGHRSLGVGQSGVLDPLALIIANRLVGNSPHTAGIEITMGPVEFCFERDAWVALTGADFAATLDGKPVWPGWRVSVKSGQSLHLSYARTGMRSYLAVDGGIAVPSVLGSCSTDLNSCFGGFDGRTLHVGDCLPLGKPNNLDGKKGVRLPILSKFIRVIPGPEYNFFTKKSRLNFWIQNWKVTPQSNRMGYRLQGNEAINLKVAKDILSHGVLPGVIQVPPNGQPIVLLSDAQTTGGYPRIGVVIESDLWKLAQVKLGSTLRFVCSNLVEAELACNAQEVYLKKLEWSLYGC